MKKTIAAQEYSDFIDWLIAGRDARGLSMRALAERLNLPHSFVQKIESKERRLDVYEFAQYCEALGLDPHDGMRLLTSKK
jgi:transcriptional regulator with XRE-family HTH domain